MVHAILGLLACQLAGEVIARLASLPVPGPVLGMVFLLVALLVRGRVPESLESVSGGLLAHLSLLFVPAGVGVMVHAGRIRADWLPLTAALLVSTIATIAVTAVVFRAVHRRLAPPSEGVEE